MSCGKCGNMEFFLRKKGNNIGKYCSKCGQWDKWAGKKDVENLKRVGYRVFEESYIPPQLAVQHQYQQEVPYDMPTPPAQPQRSAPSLSTVPLPEEPPFNDTDSFPFSQGIGGHFANGSHRPSNDDVCQVCATGVVDSLSATDDVSFSIYDKVLFVRNRENSKVYGSCRVLYCPSCGKKL